MTPQPDHNADSTCPRNDACEPSPPGRLDARSDPAGEAAGQIAPVNGMSTEYRPARGYSWPPFEPGHTYSLVHGAESPRVIEAKAAEVREQIRTIAPWLDEPAYLPAVSRWLRAEARALLLHDHIDAVSSSKGTGAVPSRTWEQATASDRLAARLGTDLGLDPIGRARIVATATSAEVGQATLADLAEQGRQTSGYRRHVLDATTDDQNDVPTP